MGIFWYASEVLNIIDYIGLSDAWSANIGVDMSKLFVQKGGGIHVLFTTVEFVTCPVSGLYKGMGVCWYATGVLNIMVIEYMVSTYIYICEDRKKLITKKKWGNFIYFNYSEIYPCQHI